MKPGFFSLSKVTSKKPQSTLPKCGLCGLYKSCLSPKMKPTGLGEKRILIITDAPGQTEDERGIHLVGESGRFLRKILKSLGIDLDRDCWKTCAVCCRPPENHEPTKEMVSACRPSILNTIQKYKPNVIIPLGMHAIRSVVGAFWKEDVDSLGQWLGWTIPMHHLNTWICPSYHPAFVIRSNALYHTKIFKAHLKQAIKKATNRPWSPVPDYKSDVEIILDTDKASKIIEQMRQKGGDVSFDFETNALKPEYKNTAIYSCAICWRGKRTIAYPWMGAAINSTKRLFQDENVGKIGHNIKFEHRWVRYHLRTHVRNWVWCSMQAAHILNNTPKTTSLKFQAFTVLGMGDYNDHIESLLKSSHHHINKIKEIDTHDLLLYNGLDALLTFKLAEHQRNDRRLVE